NHALEQLVLVVSLRFYPRGHGFESVEGIIPSCHVSIHVADTWAHVADTWIHMACHVAPDPTRLLTGGQPPLTGGPAVQVSVMRYCSSEVISTRLGIRGSGFEDSRS
ncbi:hypothetical protein Tco_0750908, partial [Tanacetum coccineum]